jgi:hypothetical protein
VLLLRFAVLWQLGVPLWGLCYLARSLCFRPALVVLVLCLSTARGWARGSMEEYEKTERLFVAWLYLCLHGVGGCAARACASQLTTTFTVVCGESRTVICQRVCCWV